MGTCKYCGKKTKLFRDHHDECEAKHQERQALIKQGWGMMVSTASGAARGELPLDQLDDQLATLAGAHHIAKHEMRRALTTGWEKALDFFLEDSVLSEEEEDKLVAFADHFALTAEELDAHGAQTRAAMAGTLRDVLAGKIPSRLNISGDLAFNLQKSEGLVWAFADVTYYEERTRRSYAGGHTGVSVRVMKGFYLRTGAFRGHPVEHTSTERVDAGALGITTKHIYFAGASKTFRIPYKKIVSFTPYEDGLGIHRDAASAKPQIFVTGEGWFIYNLVVNLAKEA